MSLSRSAKITILLVIDLLFFFTELSVGYAVGSLALIADSFHMLNDVMSLVVALYAIKLTASTQADSRYSYGWHRAEILAALVNGVFLLALCFSISLEALERFFDISEISNPRLVVVVGSLGLASNIVGLFLFHEHSHSHSHSSGHSALKLTSRAASPTSNSVSGETTPTIKLVRPLQHPKSPPRDADTAYSHYGHPAATRASLVFTAQELAQACSPSPATHRSSLSQRIPHNSETYDSPTSLRHHRSMSVTDPISHELLPSASSSEGTPLLQEQEDSIDMEPRSHPHSHHGSSMNMRALVLHVLGDALGNVGVIASGLIVWKTSWPFKYYFDPIISLIITLIIFSSALPLVRSASFILLQGVPATISLDEVKSSILAVPGVISLHELHVWQLSETKIVASVHILSERKHDFMRIADNICSTLHHLGIHSCTIQPEYTPSEAPLDSKRTGERTCLILCPPDQACDPSQNACCPPPSIVV